MMAAVLVTLNILILHEVFSCGNHVIYDEGEFVECTSAFCYLFASVLTFFRSFHRQGLERKLTLFFALTSLLFFIRELDCEDFNIPYLLITLSTGTGRDILFSLLFLLLLVSMFFSEEGRSGLRFKNLLKSKVILMALAGGLLLIVGAVFERMHSNMIEELLEMNGALLILFAALLHETLPMTLSSRERRGLQF